MFNPLFATTGGDRAESEVEASPVGGRINTFRSQKSQSVTGRCHMSPVSPLRWRPLTFALKRRERGYK